MSMLGMHRDEPDVILDTEFQRAIAIELGLSTDSDRGAIFAALLDLRSRVPLPPDNEPELEEVIEVDPG